VGWGAGATQFSAAGIWVRVCTSQEIQVEGTMGGVPLSEKPRRFRWDVQSRSLVTQCALVFSLLLLICLPALSQINFGRILGTVTDPSGGAISGAAVTITNVQTGASQPLTTESDGGFVAPALPPGTYSVRAEARGFKAAEHQDVIVEVGKDTRVDVALQVGASTQTVTVTEAPPLVDTTGATLGGTIDNESINDLPLNGRNFQNLITLRPGVIIQPGGGAWTQSTNGLRAGATIYYVDGLMDNDYNVGWTVVNAPTPTTEAGSILPIDAIQEFNLEQNPKAEFGWKPGEVVNVGIKSGTNSLHGSAYAFGRDSAWDARNFFNPVGQTKLPLNLENFGATVGGPIFKDKLFFFLGYEGRRDLIGNSFGVAIPESISREPLPPTTACATGGDCSNSIVDAEAALTAAGVPISGVSTKLLGLYPANATGSTSVNLGFPNTDQTDNGIAKIDFRVNDHNSLNGVLFVSKYTGVGEDRAYANAKFLSVIPMKDWVNNYSWIWTPNSRWVNEARFGFNRMTQDIINADSGVSATSYGINTGITSPGGLPTIQIGPFTELGTSFTRPAFNGPSPLYDGLDNVSYVRGKHTLKFGFELARIHADAAGFAFGRGQISFLGGGIPASGPGSFPEFLCAPPNPGGLSCSTPLEDFLAGYAGFPALVLQGNPARHLRQWSWAGFAQDDWRLSSRITLNLGLRYEYFGPPSEQNNLIGNFSPTLGLEQLGKNISQVFRPDRTNFSPRLGIAWDPTGTGKTSIRAGGGVLYDHPFLGEFFGQLATQDGAATGIGTIPTGFLLSSDGVTFAPGPGTISSGVIASAVGPAQWNGQVFASTTPACAPFAPCGVLGIVPNFKYPYIANWNLGVQYSFTHSLGLDVEYVGNHGERLTTITNINQPTPTSGTPAPPFAAAFPYLGFINQLSNFGHSNYNGLQVTLNQHTSHGLSFLAGYTYSHALDISSLDAFAIMPQDSQHPGRDYASSDFDIRHHFTLTTTYAIPGRNAPLQLLKGWQINSLVTLESGQPWTVDDMTHNFSNTLDFTDRWDFIGRPSDFTSGPVGIPFCSGTFETVGAVSCNGIPAGQVATAQAACFADAPSISTLDKAGCYVKGKSVMVPPAFGTFGTMRRNLFRDSGFRDWDVSVFKTWTFGERVSGQFRAEFFNVLNHPNFANPYGGPNGFGTAGPWNPGAPGLFGCGCATPDVAAGNPVVGSGDARAVQLGFKLLF
jgi:Carboxypeptidase regulatory-like domain/TonB dependent receptor